MRGIVVDVRTKARRLVEDDTPLPKTAHEEPKGIDLAKLAQDVEALKAELLKVKRAIETLHEGYKVL